MYRLLLFGLLACMVTACAGNPPSVIPYEDVPQTGDSANGAMIFAAQACDGCHMTGATGAPLLEGFGNRAGSTVPEQSAHEYTFYSIAEPGQYIVEGYGNAMPNNYDNILTAQDMADLIAYLLDL